MTIDWHKYWWHPGFALAFFAVGVPYWLIPYNKVNFPNAVLGVGLLVVIIAAVLARLLSGKGVALVTLALGSVLPAVVMARVLVEGVQDPTSHNLWPFEFIIAVFVGGGAALAGALIGSIVLRIWKRN